jgi:hypothetical protein
LSTSRLGHPQFRHRTRFRAADGAGSMQMARTGPSDTSEERGPMSELASESMSQRLREALLSDGPAEPRGTAAGGAGGVGKHSEAVR